MPHCILEYSSNIKEIVDTKNFFSRLHSLVAETGVIDIARIKSRAVSRDDFHVGDGAAANAFVYLQFAMLSGRSPAEKKALGEKIYQYLYEQFSKSISELNCSVTLELREIDSEFHYRSKR